MKALRVVGRAVWLFVLLQVVGFFAWSIWRVVLGAAGVYDEGVIALATLPTIAALAVWYFRQRRRPALKPRPTESLEERGRLRSAWPAQRVLLWAALALIVVAFGVLGGGYVRRAWHAADNEEALARAARDTYECDRDATAAAGAGHGPDYERLYEKCMAARGYARR